MHSTLLRCSLLSWGIAATKSREKPEVPRCALELCMLLRYAVVNTADFLSQLGNHFPTLGHLPNWTCLNMFRFRCESRLRPLTWTRPTQAEPAPQVAQVAASDLRPSTAVSPEFWHQGWREARLAKLHERQPEKVLWHSNRLEDPKKIIKHLHPSFMLLDSFCRLNYLTSQKWGSKPQPMWKSRPWLL